MKVQHPFMVGDIWRGYLSSCFSQKSITRKKDSIYLPRHVVDFLVEDVADDGNVTFLYTEHTYNNQYHLHGIYDPVNFHIRMTPGNWVTKRIGVNTCDSEGFLSLDLTTFTGTVLCPDPCENGGGEFILRHDRTQFQVSSAGNKAALGFYYNLLPGEDIAHAKMYKGKPMFRQVQCTVDTPFCGSHYLHQRQVNGHHFWLLIRSHSTNETNNNNENQGTLLHEEILYSAWSDEVTPPLNGWRAIQPEDRPAPMVTPVVSSIYSLQNHELYDEGHSQLDQETTAQLATYALYFTAGLFLAAYYILRRKKIRLKIPLFDGK
mmetsp:Transcript_4020/g.5592  ORF Transcript_4020/g.5592 Transcript_4020/m.5592 type:complete len:319 (+) Transcript_4020:193-1149(+)|eukprot:CAMPEP_0117745816 /NCGR_PEP_ID=MMETSP0947-20121206/7588_1 /TAXON_ID=44440 /ORGANISM="Chattonella subsalsa, Strain CCMP2191" /LENGTH=318 /DNA_ID=CAMNT_0005563045 /DNA_START=193 /DNA_END=1149 /DNA_ORIENTATION=-